MNEPIAPSDAIEPEGQGTPASAVAPPDAGTGSGAKVAAESERGSSTYATGGGGVSFAHRVAAVYLASMLTGDRRTEASELPVRRVSFQTGPAHPVDDLLVACGDKAAEVTLAVACRATPNFVQSHGETVKLVGSLLAEVEKFDTDSHQVAVAVAGWSNQWAQLATVSDIARAHDNPGSFQASMDVDVRWSGPVRDRFNQFLKMVGKTVDDGTSVQGVLQLAWRLLGRLHVLGFKVQSPDTSGRTAVATSLDGVASEHVDGVAVRDRLEVEATRYDATGAVVNLDLLRRDLHVLIDSTRSRTQPPIPWVPPALDWVVERPELSERLIGLLQVPQSSAFAAVVGAHGTGGFGKTTLAKYVCRDQRIKGAFPGGLLWITLGEDVRGLDLAQRINEAAQHIPEGVGQRSRQKSKFVNPQQAGIHLGALLDRCPEPVLLVIDDVWTEQQLEPFRHGGSQCVRLVTTRDPWLVPRSSAVVVDLMSEQQATMMLERDIPNLPPTLLDELLAATGRWPVLLNLVNRALYRNVVRGISPIQAAEEMLEQLRRKGPSARDDDPSTIDIDNPEHRSKAVDATVRSGLGLLPAGAEDRFVELAAFSAYREIPVAGLELLWSETGGLDADATKRMVEAFADMSLLDYRPGAGTVRLHDVLQDYVTHRSPTERTTACHQALLDAAAHKLADEDGNSGHAWWTLPRRYDGVFAQLSSHLAVAGRNDERHALVTDLRWAEAAIRRYGPWLVERDGAEVLARPVRQSAHLLIAAATGPSLGAVLASRLSGMPKLRSQIAHYEEQLDPPRLTNKWPLPDEPHPALTRTIVENEHDVRRILTSVPEGRLATAHDGGLVCVWDIEMGQRLHSLDVGLGSDDLPFVRAVSSGSWLAICDMSRTQVWDLTTEQLLHVINHQSFVHTLLAAAGEDFLVTLEEDNVVRILDATTGRCRHQLTGDGRSVLRVCVATDGSWLAVADDHAINFCDPRTGEQRSTASLDGSRIRDVASAARSKWLATCGPEREVELWDPDTGVRTAPLPGSRGSSGLIVPADGHWLATAENHAFRIWDLTTKTCVATVDDPDGQFSKAIAAPNGAWLAMVGYEVFQVVSPRDGQLLLVESIRAEFEEPDAVSCDGDRLAAMDYHDALARIWDPTAGMRQYGEYPDLSQGTEQLEVSPDGSWLVADGSADDALTVCHVETGRRLHRLAGHNGYISRIYIPGSGRWVVTVGSDHTVRFWDPETGRGTHVLYRTIAAQHNEIVFPRPGIVGDLADRWIAVVDHDVVRMWSYDTGTLIRTLEGHTKPIQSLSIASDGTWLASAGQDGTVRVWEASTGDCTRVIETDEQLRDASFLSTNDILIVSVTELSVYSPETGDHRRIFSGQGSFRVKRAPNDSWTATLPEEGQACVWDLRTGMQLAVLSGHSDAIHTIVVSDNSEVLVTIARDYTMRIWNTHTWQCTHVLRYEEFIHSRAITADGCWLATASNERRIVIWNTVTGSIQAEMWLDSPVNWLLWLPGSYDLCVYSYDGLNMYTLITA